MTYGIAASLASVLAFGGLVGSLPIATLSDFFGRKKLIFCKPTRYYHFCFVVACCSVKPLDDIHFHSNLWYIFWSHLPALQRLCPRLL